MRSVVLASLRVHTRRYVAAALAIAIGVAFVVTTAALASATRDGLTQGVSAPFEAADVVATGVGGEDAVRLVAAAEEAGAEASVLGWVVEQVRVADGSLADADEVAQVATGDLRWQELVDGTFPTRAGQAAVDVDVARRDAIALGDRLEVGSGGDRTVVEVVAVVDSPSLLVRADVYLTWADLAPLTSSMYVDSVAWAGPTDALREAAPAATLVPADQHVADLTAEVNRGVDVIAILLLLFAAIALFVSVLVIANTFSILFAQRQRDLALLRCVGATRRQVLGSVRVEALLLGAASTVVGLLAGTGLGLGVVALVNDRFPDARLGEAAVSPAWYAGAAATGLLVTLVASWLPTRRVTDVDPLAALRPDTGVDPRTAAGRVRIALGVLAVGAGAGMLGVAVWATSPQAMVAGGVVSFSGVLLLLPLVVPALIAAAARVAGRLIGPPGRLAAGNAVRNPRRTAATTASLLIGVTLTTAVLTGMASARGAVDDEMDVSYPLDATLTVGAAALPAGAADTVGAIEGVADAVVVPGTRAEVGVLGDLPVLAAPDDLRSVARGAADTLSPRDDQVMVPYDLVPDDVVERVSVTGSDGRVERLEVVLGEGWGDAVLVSRATLDRLTDAPTASAVWVRAEDGADAGRLADDLDVAATSFGGTAAGGLGQRAYVDLQLDVVTGAVVGLLGIAVVIALVGIANTLGLSVLERGREHALLRALGLTRRQLRTMLALEAVLLSVVATVLGTAIGTTFAWVGIEAMVRAVTPDAPLVLPWGQLAVVVLVAGVAGLLACVLPARRAARVGPAAGLALD